jgi:hypothetical protein
MTTREYEDEMELARYGTGFAPSEQLKRLTGEQLRRVLEAARQLRERKRESFYRLVTTALAEKYEADDGVGDGQLYIAIRHALRELHEAPV